MDGSSRSAASRPFWGRRRTAAPPKESAGPSATGNRKSGTLPRCGRLEHTGKKSAVRRRESSLCQSSQSLSVGKSAPSQKRGPGAATTLLAPTAAGRPLPREHSGLSAASWEAPTCGEGSADTRVWSAARGSGPTVPPEPASGPGAGLHLLRRFLGTRTPLRPVPALPSTSRVTSADHKHPSPWNTVCPALSPSNGASDSPQHKALGPTAQSRAARCFPGDASLEPPRATLVFPPVSPPS